MTNKRILAGGGGGHSPYAQQYGRTHNGTTLLRIHQYIQITRLDDISMPRGHRIFDEHNILKKYLRGKMVIILS